MLTLCGVDLGHVGEVKSLQWRRILQVEMVSRTAINLDCLVAERWNLSDTDPTMHQVSLISAANFNDALVGRVPAPLCMEMSCPSNPGQTSDLSVRRENPFFTR